MKCGFLLLADAAQMAGDKVSLLGGGWRFVHVQQLPATLPMAIVAGLVVDWNETNLDHAFAIEIAGEDGGAPIFATNGQFQQGRPAGIPRGFEQSVSIVIQLNGLRIEKPGAFGVSIAVNGETLSRTSFVIVERSPSPQP